MKNVIYNLRKERHITQSKICEYLGIDQSTLSLYEHNKRQIPDNIKIKLAQFFNVSTDYLLGINENSNEKNKQGYKIPVLGTIPAGIPIEAITDILDYEEITEEMAKTGTYFALKVKGDSMMPSIQPNDVIILRQQDDAENGSICAVMVNGFDATLKKIKKDTNGIVLVPLNSNYEPLFFTNEDILTKPVKIIGKAVEIRRTLK